MTENLSLSAGSEEVYDILDASEGANHGREEKSYTGLSEEKIAGYEAEGEVREILREGSSQIAAAYLGKRR